MRLTVAAKKTTLIVLLMPLLMASGCSSLTHRSPTWPTNLNVIELSDGGVCLDAESARRLAEFRADLEVM